MDFRILPERDENKAVDMPGFFPSLAIVFSGGVIGPMVLMYYMKIMRCCV
jgi:hypothetical protein